MNIKYENLSKEEAFVVNWQYRVLKGEAMELADAIAKADSHNRAVFEYFFPEYTQGITNFQSKSGYWPAVEVKAGLLDPDWEEKYNQRQLKLQEA
jgi:hypothetical protein